MRATWGPCEGRSCSYLRTPLLLLVHFAIPEIRTPSSVLQVLSSCILARAIVLTFSSLQEALTPLVNLYIIFHAVSYLLCSYHQNQVLVFYNNNQEQVSKRNCENDIWCYPCIHNTSRCAARAHASCMQDVCINKMQTSGK